MTAGYNGFSCHNWGIHAQWRIYVTFLSDINCSFHACSSRKTLWISMCKVIGCDSRLAGLGAAPDAAMSKSRLPPVGPSSAPSPADVEEVGVGDDDRGAAPDPAQCATSPPGSTEQRGSCSSAPGRGGQHRRAIATVATRGPIDHRPVEPQAPNAPSSPVSAKSGGGRRRSPSGALARPVEPRIGKQDHAPAAAHPGVELDQDVGGLRARDAPSAGGAGPFRLAASATATGTTR